MKKIITSILLCFLMSLPLIGEKVKIVDTSYEQSLMKSIGVNDYSLVTNDDWYFSKDGIDKTAEKMVEKLPSGESESIILYGISLGGTVVRRMTQIADEKGKNVKGYIAQSSPLSGDRLTNTAWATTSLVMLGAYSTVGLNSLIWGLPWEDFLGQAFSRGEYDLYNELDEKTKSLIDQYENYRNVNRNDERAIIEDVTLPLLDAIFGIGENGRGMFDYFSAVFSKGNNVKDLDPLGSFMVDTMNSEESLEKEIANNKKRAFLESTNGNVYETSAWSTVQPILSYYQNQRDSYWAKAKSQWWLFVYWSLRAAASSLSVATVEGLPAAWSTCVSGSTKYSTNDGFVPAKDTFWGKELGMKAPNMRDLSLDVSYTCDKVSHLDYGEKFAELPNKHGRSYSRAESVKQQQTYLKEAYDFMTD